MKKENFVLIDSNIYIHLCFLDLEFDSGDVLEKLNRLLNANKFKLLLPEVVELEFKKKFDEKIELINREVDNLIGIIQQSAFGSKKVKNNLTKSIKKGKDITLKEIEKINKDIKDIFKHSNTIRNDLQLTHETLTEAYRMFLKGGKPYKKSTNEKKTYENIQPDCLIIASVARYLKDKKDYKLFFSTGNIYDFTENPKIKNRDDLKLAPNIKSLFKDVHYYFDPLKMLNKNFAAGYKKQTIEKFEEKRSQSLSNLSIDYKDILAPVHSVAPFMINNSLAAIENANLGNSIIEADISRFTDSFKTISPVSVSKRFCSNCLKAYLHSPMSATIDNGLCDSCKNIGLTSIKLYQ